MPKEKYDHQSIERKWQERWEKDKVFSVDNVSDHPGAPRHPSSDGRRGRSAYILDMFPYPSGDGLHVGHPEGYTATDIYSRYLRMNGKNVLHPMGWDAFGLPAENFAIKQGVHPAEVTAKNIANFKRQIQSLGFSYDWDREVNTTDPKYYKWTQWIFLQLFKRGLAYEKEAPIWWCPKDKTGLANEEVVNGKCDRCGTTVEKKMLKQWMLKITAYADRLLEGLNNVDWPEGIKTLQRNWIGKSEGAEVKFSIEANTRVGQKTNFLILHGYTGRADKNFIPWLKMRLEQQGYKVQAPQMPHAESPKELEQVSYVLDNCTIDEGTIIIGHSLGGVVAMKVLQKLNHPVAGLILVAPAVEPTFRTGESRPFWETFKWDFDYEQIKKRTGYRVILSDILERKNRGAYLEYLAKKISARVRETTASKIHFRGVDEPFILDNILPQVTVFTTRPDTLFGATYLVLSPEHELVKQITTSKQKKAVEKYVKSVAAKSDLERTSLEKEKTGVFTGAYAENPINKFQIPIWIADYVLSSYGTGAIMAVPAHDKRDRDFQKFRDGLEKINVIRPKSFETFDANCVFPQIGPHQLEGETVAETTDRHNRQAYKLVMDGSYGYDGEGVLINSGQYDGMDSSEARKKIVTDLEKEGKARATVQYKLRDWVFSRQRYWGEPIPLVKCESCKIQVESTPHYLNFYNQNIWENLINGRKTIETRALNPEEPDRFFGDIKVGAYIKGVFKTTGTTAYFRVKNVKQYKSLKELFADKEAMAGLAPTKTFKSLKELEAAYEKLSPGYVEKINKNGLIAFEVKHIIPGILPLKENELPLELPNVEKYEPTGTGESPLADIDTWVNVKCRICGQPAKRETNTMPQWAGSCWYYLRFCDPKNDKEFASAEAMKTWLPVDMYVGGAEHAVLHLLYARFWHKVLFDAGFIPKEVGDEPFKKLKNQGLILGPDGEKMSKSRGNVINPDEIVAKFGADTLRMYEMFMGPFEDAKPWDTNGILGVRRFLDKVWRISEKKQAKDCPMDLVLLTHKTIKKVTEDIENFRFNTAVSSLMILANAFDKLSDRPREEFENFLWLLKPFAPHIASEILDNLQRGNVNGWPVYDKKLIEDIDTVTIAVQVMGKLRGTLTMPTGSTQADVEPAAKAEPNVAKYLTSEPKKVIFVPDKLINFVV